MVLVLDAAELLAEVSKKGQFFVLEEVAFPFGLDDFGDDLCDGGAPEVADEDADGGPVEHLQHLG